MAQPMDFQKEEVAKLSTDELLERLLVCARDDLLRGRSSWTWDSPEAWEIRRRLNAIQELVEWVRAHRDCSAEGSGLAAEASCEALNNVLVRLRDIVKERK